MSAWNHRSHAEWLQSNREKYEALQRAHAAGIRGEALQRLLSISPPASDWDVDSDHGVHASGGVEVDFDAPVYRSIGNANFSDEVTQPPAGPQRDSMGMAPGTGLRTSGAAGEGAGPTSGPAAAGADADVDAIWLSSGRPPMLRRQAAFCVLPASP